VEHREKGEREGPSPAQTPVVEVVTEKGEEEEKALTEGVQPETDGGRESDGRAAAETGREKETETKARRGERGAKMGSEGGARRAERGLMGTEGATAPIRLSRLRVQGLIVRVS